VLCVCVLSLSLLVGRVCVSTRLAIPLSLEIFWTVLVLALPCCLSLAFVFRSALARFGLRPFCFVLALGFGLRPSLVLIQQLLYHHILSKGWLSAVAVATVEARPAGVFAADGFGNYLEILTIRIGDCSRVQHLRSSPLASTVFSLRRQSPLQG
jgi:hypothetical protein